jgi:large subunit ribosomal protein L15
MPLIRRIPKRGFNNAQFKTRYAVVNLGDLEQFDAGTSIDESFLREQKVIRGTFDGLKVLGSGELTKSLTVVAAKVSASAKEKIERAGGTVTLK